MTAGENKTMNKDEQISCSPCCARNNPQDVSPILPIKPIYNEELIKPVPGKIPASRTGFLCSFLVDARGGAMTGHRHWGMRLVIPPGAVSQPTRINCRYQNLQSLSYPPPFMEREALASRIIEISPALQTFRSPVLLEIPHFASNAGGERETVILRSDDGEIWSQHISDIVEDGEIYQDVVGSVVVDDFGLERIYDALEVDRGRVVRVLTSLFPKYFAIITRIREEVKSMGPDGGKVSLIHDTRCRATFPKHALHKKIKVGLQVQTLSSELVQAAFGRSVEVSKIVAVEPRKRKFHQPFFVSIPLPCSGSKINSSTDIRLICSVTGSLDPVSWVDMTGSTPLEVNKDVVHFSTKVSALFWILLIHDNTRDPSSALTLATRLYEETRLVPYLARISIYYREKFPKAWVNTLRIYCMTDDKAEKVIQSLQGFKPLKISRDIEITDSSEISIKLSGNLLQLVEDPFTRELLPVSTIRTQFIRETFKFTAFQENAITLLVQPKDNAKPLAGSLAFYRKLSNISKTQNILLSQLNINSAGEPDSPDEFIKEDIEFHYTDSLSRTKHDQNLPPHPCLLESEYEEVRKPRYSEEDIYEKIEAKTENGRTTLSKINKSKIPDSPEHPALSTKTETLKIATFTPEHGEKKEKKEKKEENKEQKKKEEKKKKDEKKEENKEQKKKEEKKKKDEKKEESVSMKRSNLSLDKLKNSSLFRKKEKKEKVKSFKNTDLDEMRISYASTQGVKVEKARKISAPTQSYKSTDLCTLQRTYAEKQGVKSVEIREPKFPPQKFETKDGFHRAESNPDTIQTVNPESRDQVLENENIVNGKLEIRILEKEPTILGRKPSSSSPESEPIFSDTNFKEGDQVQPIEVYTDAVEHYEPVALNANNKDHDANNKDHDANNKDHDEKNKDHDEKNKDLDVKNEDHVSRKEDHNTKNEDIGTENDDYVLNDENVSNHKDHVENMLDHVKNHEDSITQVEIQEINKEQNGEINEVKEIQKEIIPDKDVVGEIEKIECVETTPSSEYRSIPIQIEFTDSNTPGGEETSNQPLQPETGLEKEEIKSSDEVETIGFIENDRNDDIIGFDVKPEPEIRPVQPDTKQLDFPGIGDESEIKKKAKKKSFIKEWQEDLKEFFKIGKKKSVQEAGEEKHEKNTGKSEIPQTSEQVPQRTKKSVKVENEAEQIKKQTMEESEPFVSTEDVKNEDGNGLEEKTTDDENPNLKPRKKNRSNRRKTNSANYEESAKTMLEVRNALKESEDSGNLEGDESGNHDEDFMKTEQVGGGEGQKGRKKKLTKKAQKPEDEEGSGESVRERSVLAAGGKPKVVVPTPRGIPKPKPISRITESNRNSVISTDSFTDDDLVEVDIQNLQIKVHSLEDDEEFKKAVDSFDEIFQSESRTDIQRASRKSGKRNSRKFGKDPQPQASEENDEEEVMPSENDSVPLEPGVIKNVDGQTKQRKGSARFSRKQNSRSNRSSIGSMEEDTERLSPDLTSRLVETKVQMQRLDQTFSTLCNEVTRDSSTTRSISGTQVESRGHSLSRTRVQISEDPLDQIIGSMIQTPSTNPQTQDQVRVDEV